MKSNLFNLVITVVIIKFQIIQNLQTQIKNRDQKNSSLALEGKKNIEYKTNIGSDKVKNLKDKYTSPNNLKRNSTSSLIVKEDNYCVLIIKKFLWDIKFFQNKVLRKTPNCRLMVYDYFVDSLLLKKSNYLKIRFFLRNRSSNTNINIKKLYFDRIALFQKIFKNILNCISLNKVQRNKLTNLITSLDFIKRGKCEKIKFCEFGHRKNIDKLYLKIKSILEMKGKNIISQKLGSILTNIYNQYYSK